MNFLLWQTLLCLALALLSGAVLGWFFRGSCKHKLEQMTHDWSERFTFIEEEKKLLATKIQDKKRLHQENKSLLSRLMAMENGANLASNVLKDNKEKLDTVENNLSKNELELKQSYLKIEKLKNDLIEMNKKEDQARELLAVAEVLNEKKISAYKAKLRKKNQELESSKDKVQESEEEIKIMLALLKAYETGNNDLLEGNGR